MNFSLEIGPHTDLETLPSVKDVYVTLFKPPYENENVLHKTGWKTKDVIITEIKLNQGEE